MRPVVAYLREQGYISVIYLDDFLLIGNSIVECNMNLDETRSLL